MKSDTTNFSIHEFIEHMKTRTRKFGVDVIKFCDALKKGRASDVIIYQIVKSATSTGANYRAACRARSKNEFFSKICIVEEEADESVYWLQVIKDAGLSGKAEELEKLLNEGIEITKIITTAKNSTYKS